MWGFPKLGGASLGPSYKGILLLGVYIGGPLVRKPPCPKTALSLLTFGDIQLRFSPTGRN